MTKTEITKDTKSNLWERENIHREVNQTPNETNK